MSCGSRSPSRARADARGSRTSTARDLLAQQPAQDVGLVHGAVGDDHRAVEERVHERVAVRAVHEQRPADRARVEPGLEVDVARVEAAHEADADEATAGGALGLDDPPRRLRRGRERLLAQHRLAGRDAREHVRLVREHGRGDDDGVHIVGRDQLQAVRVRGRRPEALGRGQVRIGDGHELRPGHVRRQPPRVDAAHQPRADDPDARHPGRTAISSPSVNGSASTIWSPLQNLPGSYQLIGRLSGSRPMCCSVTATSSAQ